MNFRIRCPKFPRGGGPEVRTMSEVWQFLFLDGFPYVEQSIIAMTMTIIIIMDTIQKNVRCCNPDMG